jgi:glycosyltransferase involved in cell wall biosynthesis
MDTFCFFCKDTKICLIFQDYELQFVIFPKKNMKNLQSLFFFCIFVDNINIINCMRILYVTDALAVWGGIERVLSDKMNYLVQEYGYEIYVVTADQGNHPIPFPLDKRIHVKDMNIRFHQQYKYHGIKRFFKYRELERLYKKRLTNYITEIRPDVISCIRDGYASAVLDIKGTIPVIFESHAMYRDVEFENATLIHRFITYLKRRKFRKLDMLVALTQGDADEWKRVCRHVCVIPNVVHLNESGKFSLCKSKNVVLAGRFDLQKDQGSMLNIWSIVQQRHPDWVLNMYGNGELKVLCEQDVIRRKLNVHIHSAVPDIFEKYLEASMLVMSSLYEPFGLVLAEAMSCGLPVVAFDCPYGPADIINNGIDGFLVEDRNVDAFAERVCQLIENEQLRVKMGKAAVLSAQRYKTEIIMPRWKQLFEQLMSKS